jgi:hypothetical protein
VPLFNQVKLFGDDVAKVLNPGERLLALGAYHEPLNGDDSKLELEDHELSPLAQRFLREHGHRLPTSDGFFQGVDWHGVHVNPDRIRRALSGSSGAGAPRSSAGRMWRATKNAGGMIEWAVTDQRLLILKGDTALHRTYTIMFAVPRSEIRSAVRRGKLLFQWGRVEVTFTDDSMLAFNAALLDIGSARQLVAALSRPLPTGDTR